MTADEPLTLDDLVSEVEVMAAHHPGQAKATLLAAFGRQDRFTDEWLSTALYRTHTAVTENQRVMAHNTLKSCLRVLTDMAAKKAS